MARLIDWIYPTLNRAKGITRNNRAIKKVYKGSKLLWIATIEVMVNILELFKERVLADGGTYEENNLTVENNLNASLMMVPTAYKAGKLYSVFPEDGTGDFTVDRASAATRVNAQGLIELVPANTPRIDYSTGEPMLLVEGQATNLITWSGDFNNSYWIKAPALVAAYNSEVGPDGTLTATKISSNDTDATFKTVITPRINFTSGTQLTASIFIKKETSETNYGGCTILLRGSVTKAVRVIFNAVNGSYFVIGETGVTHQVNIVLINNYWKFSLTVQDSSANYQAEFVYYATLSTDFSTVSTGIGSPRIIWGAQLETGSKATSYIPTNGSTVTRLGDVISKSNVSNLIGQDEGTMYIEFEKILDLNSSRSLFGLRANTGISNVIEIWDGVGAANLGMIVVYIRQNNSTVDTLLSPQLPSGRYKIAVTYSSDGYSLYVNGLLVDSTSVPFNNVSVMNKIDIGNRDGNGMNLSYIKETKLLKTALTNQQLIELTTL